jgi:hypothetical protein
MGWRVAEVLPRALETGQPQPAEHIRIPFDLLSRESSQEVAVQAISGWGGVTRAPPPGPQVQYRPRRSACEPRFVNGNRLAS